ncbi:hypothetical protein Tco_0662801 [Tanacetum coccineum]
MSTTTTDDQQPQLTNGDVKSSPTEIESTDNGNADSSPEMESTANKDLDLNPKEVKQVKNDDEIKEEGNKTFTMRELLNELKNGDGNEGSEPAADTATPPDFEVAPDTATPFADSEVAPDTATPFGFDFVTLVAVSRDVHARAPLGVVLAGDGAEVVLAMNDYATLSG